MALPDGTKVIEAGASVNPLDHVPFTHRLIVFDASDPRQVETAHRLGETDSPQRPLYLATRFDRGQGWEGLRTVADRLDLFSGKLMTDICWACLFPVRIAGLPIGGGQVPAGAATSAFCGCATGAGFTIGMWEPARIIELTHAPGCSAALGGSRLPMGSRRLIGTEGKSAYDSTDVAFWHYHWYSFPLLILLDLFWDRKCNADGLTDFDILYLSELDPTWNNGELAFFTNPEAAWLANPVAQAACLADATAATAGSPIDSLFWCAGTWGNLYPFTGVQPNLGSDPRETSLAAVRSLAALHRRGMARRTMGNDAVCKAPIDFFVKKSAYKLTMFYPLPETQKAHVIGQSTFTWGESRTIPGPGEHQLYLLWRWSDCCAIYE